MSSRLPIYKSLNRRLEVLGLGIWELGFLCCLFVLVANLLQGLPFRSVVAFVVTLTVAGALRQLNRRYEKNFILRLIRFCALPAHLDRQLEISPPKEKSL